MDVDKIRVFERNMNLVDVTGLFATVSTIGMMLAGLPLCTQMMREGTHNVQLFPFIAFFTNCVLWSGYGILKLDPAIIRVNIVGCFLEGSYVVVYFLYTSDKSEVFKQFLYLSIALLPLCAYSNYVEDTTQYLGRICTIAAIISYGSPLSEIKRVLRTRSADSISFIWCFVSAITAFTWAFYGYLQDDSTLIMPNVIGLALSAVQILLIAKFPKAGTVSKKVNGKLVTKI